MIQISIIATEILRAKEEMGIKEANPSQQQDRQTLQSLACGNQLAIKGRSKNARKASKLQATCLRSNQETC